MAVTKGSPGQRRSGGLIVLFLGLLALGVAGYLGFCNIQFQGPVRHTSGRVDELYVQSGRHHSNLMVRYHYPAAETSHQGTIDVTEHTWTDLQVGSSVPVKYLENHPASSRLDLPIEDLHQAGKARDFLLMGILFLGIGYYLFRK